MNPRAFLLSWASLFMLAAAGFGIARLVAPDVVGGFGLIACGLIGVGLIIVATRVSAPAESCDACGRKLGPFAFCDKCGALKPRSPSNAS